LLCLDYPTCKILNCWRSYDASIQDRAVSLSLLLLPIKEANTSVMTICNQCPLWLPRMQNLKSLTLRWCSVPGWVREPLSTYFDYKGGQYIQKEQPGTIINILWSSVGYLSATINRATCDAKPEIGLDGSSQTRRDRGLTGTVRGVDGQEAASRLFGRFWNWTRPLFRSKPGPHGGYPDPLPSLIRQHNKIKTCIMLAILGRWIKARRCSTGKRWIWISISGR